jgi:hypothetical protein
MSQGAAPEQYYGGGYATNNPYGIADVAQAEYEAMRRQGRKVQGRA